MPSTDRRADLVRSYENAAVVVSSLEPGQLSGPTPCPEYDVAALVDHLVGAGWRAAALGRGEQPGADEFPHVGLAEAPDQLRQAGKEAEAAWSDDSRLAATITMPWGETYTGETLVNMYLAELAGHAWDIASATKQLDRLDQELATAALEGARAMLKPEYRNMMGEGNPFGSEVTPPADATAWERFAAFMGRQPRSGKP
ncbi:MAG TPA: TIGR03086 family metal-binding protein [Acidimicrobiales bacterium]|nr:TIGR03086 family metal-binding protein [Acidimicrobiales bacterium]